MGGVFTVLIIALVVLIFGRVFNYFKTPIWLSISIFVLLSFSGSYYIIRKALPFYFDTFGFEEWFLVFLLGSTFSGLAIYIFNDFSKDGIF